MAEAAEVVVATAETAVELPILQVAGIVTLVKEVMEVLAVMVKVITQQLQTELVVLAVLLENPVDLLGQLKVIQQL